LERFATLGFVALFTFSILGCTKTSNEQPSSTQAKFRNDGRYPLRFLNGEEMMAADINVDNDVWMQHSEKVPSATSEQQCKKLGGAWRFIQFNRRWICDVPTPDADKACHDDRECATFCAPNQQSDWYKKSEGSCESHYFVMGCVNGMTNGYPRNGPCID